VPATYFSRLISYLFIAFSAKINFREQLGRVFFIELPNNHKHPTTLKAPPIFLNLIFVGNNNLAITFTKKAPAISFFAQFQ
jgi:hypothetical protein